MKKIFFITALLTLISSCQKVIDVDLNEANANVVIEANLTAEDSTLRIRITETSSYFDSETSPVLSNATVTIIDESGTPTSVPSIGNGNYELTNYIPQFSTTYTLNVVVNGNSYSAQCTLHQPVNLEDITYQYFPGFFGSDGGYAVFLNFNDPAGITNHYQIVLTENGEEKNKLTDLFTQDDALTDGNYIERPLFGGSFYEIGDSIGMELRTVDQIIYNYTNEAQSIAGGSNSAAPGNPTTNWDNGALGYFSAYGNSRKEVVIQ